MDKINIIMASYQGSRYISEQIESLLKSDYQDFFLHIFDDGSMDGTVNIAEEYERKYPDKIKVYVNSMNLGHVNNFLNGLISIASSKSRRAGYYMFCDQDDVWKKDKMSLFINRMKKLEKKYGSNYPLLVFSDALVVDENLKILHRSYHKSQSLNTDKRNLPAMLMENKCSGCMMMINEALALKIKRLPSNARYHDWWITLAASAFGHISYIDKPLIMYRQHAHNKVGNQDRLHYLVDRIRNINAQKKALHDVMLQADEFLMTYKEELTEEALNIIKDFACLSNASWAARRMTILKNGYYKSTYIRNIGILLLI